MPSKLFDNIVRRFAAYVQFTGATIASTEINLNLPRGYVAKISLIRSTIMNALNEMVGGVSVDTEGILNVMVTRDPNDTVNIDYQNGANVQDIVLRHNAEFHFLSDSLDSNNFLSLLKPEKEEKFDDNRDLVVARNMRWNIVASGTDGAGFTDAFSLIEIDYTLEKIKDEELLEILEIL